MHLIAITIAMYNTLEYKFSRIWCNHDDILKRLTYIQLIVITIGIMYNAMNYKFDVIELKRMKK